jgi:hypothetical protein
MEYRFRFPDGEIFIWENYSKHSKLLDELDPDPSTPIDIIGDFTYEDFEKAHILYQKYMLFKEDIKDFKEIMMNFSFDLSDNKDLISKYSLDAEFNEKDTEEDREEKDKENDTPSFSILGLRDEDIYDYLDSTEKSKKHNYIKTCNFRGKIIEKYNKKFIDFINSTDEIDFNNPVFEWLMIHKSKEETEFIEFIKNTYKPEYKELVISLSSYQKQEIESSKLQEIKYDNLMVYLSIDFFTNSLINTSIRNGHIKSFEWLYNYYIVKELPFSIDSYYDEKTSVYWGLDHDLDWVNFFELACYFGELEIAQFLYSTGKYNFNPSWFKPLLIACSENRINIVKWIFSLDQFKTIKDGSITVEPKTDDQIYDEGDLEFLKWDAFYYSSCLSSLELTKWIYENGISEIKTNLDIKWKRLIKTVLKSNKLELIQWFYEIKEALFKSTIDTYIFKELCLEANLEIIKFVYEIVPEKIDIYYEENKIFKQACQYGNLEIAQWLYSISKDRPGGSFKKEDIRFSNYTKILEWLDTLE